MMYKENLLIIARLESQITYKGTKIELMTEFLVGAMVFVEFKIYNKINIKLIFSLFSLNKKEEIHTHSD